MSSGKDSAKNSDFVARYGPWALVAGASEGLGAEFARQLAARGLNVLLVARRAEPLEVLATELRQQHRIEARIAVVDLSDRELPTQLAAVVGDLEIGLVVYNAAHSLVGPFLDQELAGLLRTLDVNCRGPVVLSHVLGQQMAQRGRGGIVLMSSMAATQGVPLVATYAATKAFNLVLAEGLWEELGRVGVDVVACRAGATRTPAYERSQPQGSAGKGILGEPGPVVTAALQALGRHPSVVPGWVNRFAAGLLGHLLPRRTAIQIMAKATRSMYER